MFLYYETSKARGDIQGKGVSQQFCFNKESNNDPIGSNTINQSNTMLC